MIDLSKDLFIAPNQFCSGSVAVAGSKSISNRVLLMAALSTGITELKNLLISEDTQVMLDALKKLGVRVERSEGGMVRTYFVHGCGGKIPIGHASLFLANAGTAFRPLTAVLSLTSGYYEMLGVKRMYERPVGHLVDGLQQLGANISYKGREGYPPIVISPQGPDKGGSIEINGEVSSQFLSSILIAAPLLKRELSIKVKGVLISSPYVDMTINLMRQFGVKTALSSSSEFTVLANQGYFSPGKFWIEGDASNASYFFAAGLVGEGPVKVSGITRNSIQGDIKFLDILGKMGGQITSDTRFVRVAAGKRETLPAFDLDLSDIPDAAMTLAVIAIFCDGKCYLRNIGSWRVKETDRITAMGRELRKVGAIVEEFEDELHVTPPNPNQIPDEITIDTYDDHRMAMSLSLLVFLGLRLRVRNPKCVEKTFPRYFDEFYKLLKEFPVITIDGPAGSGKGTVAKGVAARLGLNYFDSGTLYRVTALAAIELGIPLDNETEIAKMAKFLDIEFTQNGVIWKGRPVDGEIRADHISKGASLIGKLPMVRQVLLSVQRETAVSPGLVTDGRDMGTNVFPNASLKVYLTASLDERGRRRYKQLIEKGLDASLTDILEEIRQRDNRDESRLASPLVLSNEARYLDSTKKTPKFVIDQIVRWFEGG